MKVKVLSEEIVKPKAPVPQHQKTLELSVLDQVQLRLHAPPVLGFMPPLPTGKYSGVRLFRADMIAFHQ